MNWLSFYWQARKQGFPNILTSRNSIQSSLDERLNEQEEVVLVARDKQIDTEKAEDKSKPFARNILVSLIEMEKDKYSFVQVPAIHDITGYSDDEFWDPFNNFKHVLHYNFEGGVNRMMQRHMNSVILGRDYLKKMYLYEYKQPPEDGKTTESHLEDLKGDRYRLALHSGILGLTFEKTKRILYAHASFVPPINIQPFIVLDSSALTMKQLETRMDFYLNELSDVKLNFPLMFLDKAQQYTAIEFNK
jgi:hypothetical protein